MGNKRPKSARVSTRQSAERIRAGLTAGAALFLGAGLDKIGIPPIIWVTTAVILSGLVWWAPTVFALRKGVVAVCVGIVAYVSLVAWWVLNLPADENRSRIQLASMTLTVSNYPNPFTLGKPVHMNVMVFNPGPQRAREIDVYSHAFLAPANVVNGVSDVYVRVQKEFEAEFGSKIRAAYRSRQRGLKTDLLPGETRFATVVTPTLTESDVAGFKTFDPLIVYVSIGFWRDDLGRIGEFYDCRSLNPPEREDQPDIIFRPCVPLGEQ